MKVQTNKTPVVFTPITTSITFETQEEFDTFRVFCAYSYTTSKAAEVAHAGGFNQKCCEIMLDVVWRALDEVTA